MDNIETLIGLIEPASEVADDQAAVTSFAALTSNPNLYSVEVNGSELHVTTNPIKITNEIGQSAELGRIRFIIKADGSYRFERDRTSSRDSDIDSSHIHPHISDRGTLCQGDAGTTISRLATDRNLTMLVSFMWEFLHMYNPADPHWSLRFTKPCVDCEAINCIACPCFKCSNMSDDSCRGCDKLRELSVSTGCDNVFTVLRGLRGDEDTNIELILKIKDLIETEKGIKVTRHV